MTADEQVTSLDAQIAQAYEKAEEYFQKGSYSRALSLFQQIERLRPGYRETRERIPVAEEGKRAQKFVQWIAGLTGVLFLIVGLVIGINNDLLLLAIGALGILVGIFVANVIYARQAAGRMQAGHNGEAEQE